MKSIKFIILLFTWLVTILYVAPVYAQASENSVEAEVSMSLEVTDKFEGNVALKFILKNNSKQEYLQNMVITLPFGDVKSVSVSTAKNKIPFSLKKNSNGTTSLTVDFRSLKFKPGNKLDFNINYKTGSVVTNFLGTNILVVDSPKFGFKVNNYNVLLSYPRSMGELQFSSENFQKEENNEFYIYRYTPNGNKILASWTNQFTGYFEADYTVAGAAVGEYLVSIPINNETQSVIWNKTEGADKGYYDELANEYLSYQVKTIGEEKRVNYSGVINLNYSSPIEDKKNLANVNYFTSEIVGDDALASFPEIESQIKYAYDKTIQYLEPDRPKRLTGELLMTTANNFTKEENLLASPIEYCYVLTEMLAKSGNIQFRYVFGKSILPSLNDDGLFPHIWCEIYDGNKIYVLDPYLQDLYKLNYFQTSRFGKVVFGTVKFENRVNPLFGVFTDTKQILPKFTEHSLGGTNINLPLEVVWSEHAIEIEATEVVNYKLNVLNPSSATKKVRNMYVDSDVINEFSHVELSPLLLPNRENILELNYIFAQNLLFAGDKEITVQVNLDDDQVEDRFIVKVLPNQGELTKWFMGLVMTTFLFFTLTLTMYRIRIKFPKLSGFRLFKRRFVQ